MKKSTIISMACAAGAVGRPLASNAQTVAADSVMQHNEEKFDLPEVGQATVNVSSSDKEMQKVAKVYVNQVVYPTYQALAANARTLYTTTAALYTAAESGTMTQAQIDAACEAFKDTRREWERSEAFLYGSASDNELDPHIDSWPLDHEELVNALKNPTLVAGFKGSDPAKFVSENNSHFQSVLGFHGMEFVLFREGKNRTVDALRANETEEGMTSVKGIDELAFLQAVAADVRNITALLEFTWMGSAASNETKSVLSNASYVFSSLRYNGLAANGTMCYGQFLHSPSVTTGYNLWQGTVRQIFVGGCSNICAEVADLTAALNNAIQALETAKNSGKSFVEAPGAQHVKDCIDAVSALDEELNKAGDWVNKQEAL